MRYLLTSRDRPTYGQDFVMRETEVALTMTRLEPGPEGSFDLPEDARLIVSHDLTYEDAARCFQIAPREVVRIAHTHLQWSFSPCLIQQRVERGLSRCDVGIVPAKFLMDDLSSRFPNVSWHLVHNGVNAQRFYVRNSVERAKFKSTLGLSTTDTLCAFVGRPELAKGTEILEEVILLLSTTPCHLLLQYPTFLDGDRKVFSKEAERLASLNPERVHLYPDSNPAADRPIGYCDVLIQPSLQEVASLTVLEALMSGIPVVATRASPFYEELYLAQFLTLVERPANKSWDTLHQGLLRIDDKVAARQVAEKILSTVEDVGVSANALRETIRALAIRAGGDANAMIAATGAIYDEVAPK